MRFSKLAGMVLGVALASSANAQWSSQFGVPGANWWVSALIMHDDGSGPAMYAGGLFSSIDGKPLSRIARCREGVWSDVGGGLSPPGGSVGAMTIFNGELVAAGSFHEIGGITAYNIARWDGRAWHPFGNGLSTGTSSRVSSLAVLDGQLIAHGHSLGVSSDIARWDGSAWQAMGSFTASGEPEIIVYDGALIAQLWSSPTPGDIVRWNGVDWERIANVDGQIRAFAIFNDELIATGPFRHIGGISASQIARWNGHAWRPLGEGGYSGALAVHDGKLVVGDVKVFALWDGTTWSTVPSGLGIEYPDSQNNFPRVNTLLSISDANGAALIAGGLFTTIDGTYVNNIARYANGKWSALTTCDNCQGLSNLVHRVAVHDDGSGEALYAAGFFRFAGDQPAHHVARWDGKSWSPVGHGFATEGLYVLALTEFDDGSGAGPRLYAGGQFSGYGSGSASLLVWDGNVRSQVEGPRGGAIWAMTVFDDGTGPALYVGGSFTSVDGQPAPHLAKWDGSQWSAVGGGADGIIVDMLVWDDGGGPGLVIAGAFNHVGSGPGAILAGGVARWRNNAWSTFGQSGLGGGFGRCLAAWPPPDGSSLIVGGPFSLPVGRGLALWNGTTWRDIAPQPEYLIGDHSTHRMHALRAGGCNQLFIRGGYVSTRLQVWNGETWRSMGGGISNFGPTWFYVYGNAFYPLTAFFDFATFQDRVYVAGDFTSAGGLPASNIAIWDPNAAFDCAADTNLDGDINVNDLLAVILQWGACVNCTADNAPCGGDGHVNVDDLLAVITGWGACR